MPEGKRQPYLHNFASLALALECQRRVKDDMRLKLNTIMAHPRFGCFEPGAILELDEADAKPLLESGLADPVTLNRAPAASLFETAELDDEWRENAMRPARKAKKG
jgi:hypothetical protein